MDKHGYLKFGDGDGPRFCRSGKQRAKKTLK